VSLCVSVCLRLLVWFRVRLSPSPFLAYPSYGCRKAASAHQSSLRVRYCEQRTPSSIVCSHVSSSTFSSCRRSGGWTRTGRRRSSSPRSSSCSRHVAPL
jgi:hypothetical protein